MEFALIAPIFCFIAAASLDLGLVLHTRFQLDAAVSNGTSYTLVNSDKVNAKDGGDLAVHLVTLVTQAGGAGSPEAEVTVNSGPVARYDGTTIKLTGGSGDADRCYCPKGSTAWSLEWGSNRQCTASCPDGARPGKFVAITARRAHRPLFSGYGIVRDGYISAAAVVQTQ